MPTPSSSSSILLPPRKAALIAKSALPMLYERRDQVNDLIRRLERYAAVPHSGAATGLDRRRATA